MKVYSAKQVCEMLSISQSTLNRMIERGEFPDAILISKRRKGFTDKSIKKWLEERENRKNKQQEK
ncbi:helix-turn-helix domain-containing protein [Vibrio sp. ZSDE26]|uniref:Helix-turn-helix domain-containing protein n=1 Tax=Vibrio amylolyticus TaxID=2847292 RepID=A0A9X1XJ25_9VIBR|nr:AlpA family phage regulatory protein [Vibrio amylolyticus]MCK6263927.1 helix-turn-helix domain-containing protein [Vibrio amylolyticus]